MPLDIFIALVVFVVIMVGTPGPANLLVMAAGANWGLRSCIPFIIGLVSGKLLLNIMMAVGLLALLIAQPLAAQALRVVSCLYLLYLAWRIAGMRLKQNNSAQAGKPGFFSGLIVHPLNPKAWAMSTSAYVQFADVGSSELTHSIIIALTFFIVQAVFHPLWCYSGTRLAVLLGGTVWERVLMRVLALSVVLLVLWSMLTRI